MKNSQSKFSNEKAKANSSSKSDDSSSKSSCCCGSKLSDEIDEVDFVEMEEK